MTTTTATGVAQRTSTLSYFLIAFFGSFVLSVYDVGALKGLEAAVDDGVWVIAGFKIFQGICTGIIVVFVYRETDMKKAFFLGIAMQSLMLSLKNDVDKNEGKMLATEMRSDSTKVDTLALLEPYLKSHEKELSTAAGAHDSSSQSKTVIKVILHPDVKHLLKRTDSLRAQTKQANLDTLHITTVKTKHDEKSISEMVLNVLKKY
jgi:hypothetical protein